MGKKINIMAEVDQNIYDVVVVPHKQSRSFTTLIETLLEGYYSNAYVRSFVDDKIAGVQQESSDVLNDIISNMHKGLANMGILTEDMKATAQDGIDAFSKKAEETKEEMKDIQSVEIKNLREGMEELREQVRTQNEEIMGMLKAIMSGGVTGLAPSSSPSPSKPVAVEPKAESNEEDEVLYEEPDGGGVEESTELSVTSEEEANDIMANLLVGQVYSF